MRQYGNHDGGGLKYPNPGQGIRSPYLQQEHRVNRRVRIGDGEPETAARFFAPPEGIAAAVKTGDRIKPGMALCRRARWDEEDWFPDLSLPPEPVYNAHENHSVPGSVILYCDYVWNHWEALIWDCPPA